jgi:SNF2 family DNA or RNA helicase
MIYTPHGYQLHAEDHVMNNDAAGLFMEMGLGKTVVTLTAIDKLIFSDLSVEKVLIVAPLKVAESTWIDERDKWDHLKHLKISLVLGSERKRKTALKEKADIYIINRDNIAWLIAYLGGAFPFDMLVIDELTSFKNQDSVRFKALRRVRPMAKRVVGLTGTPAPNGLIDLWAQMYMLDQGERLGKTITEYRSKYFQKRNEGYGFGYELSTANTDVLGENYYRDKIHGKIKDICISMKAEDYLDLPDLITNDIHVRLSAKTMDQYIKFERSKILELFLSGDKITAVNAGVLAGKLLQFANGAVYDKDRDVHEVHKEKLISLDETVEALDGNPVIIFYSYLHDVDRITKHLKRFNPVQFSTRAHLQQWNEGKIPVLMMHPASAGHGLNMQYGGHNAIWFGLTHNYEYYKQAIARVFRQGQAAQKWILHRLITTGTMDEDVALSLLRKDAEDSMVMKALKARFDKYRKLAAA